MRRISSGLLVLALLLTGNVLFAQRSIFAGKIVDEQNKPVAGARIKVSYTWHAMDEVQSDKDGLFYTKLLPDCIYYNVDVTANGSEARLRRVYLRVGADIRWYYNIKVAGNDADLMITAHDPFMETKLVDIEEDQRNIDLPMKVMVINAEEAEVWRMKRGESQDSTKIKSKEPTGNKKHGK